MQLRRLIISTIFISLFASCASYEKFRRVTEEYELPAKVFDADFNQTWQAVIEVMGKFDLAAKDQEAGVVKTRWTDNTTELNFTNSFGNRDGVKAAKYKLTINVVKGFRNRREVSKVTIYKRQLIEQDFLQGWKEIPSEGITEKTLLYRIERLVKIEKKLNDIQKKKEQEELSQIE